MMIGYDRYDQNIPWLVFGIQKCLIFSVYRYIGTGMTASIHIKLEIFYYNLENYIYFYYSNLIHYIVDLDVDVIWNQ